MLDEVTGVDASIGVVREGALGWIDQAPRMDMRLDWRDHGVIIPSEARHRSR